MSRRFLLVVGILLVLSSVGLVRPAGAASAHPGAVRAGISSKEYPIPTTNSYPAGITAGPDGNLWFIEANGAKIGRMTPKAIFQEYPVSTDKCAPNDCGLENITVGPDGNLWFTETLGNRIGRITLTGVITEFVIPTSSSYPEDITAGPDGNLWFTESDGNKIGRITPLGVITEFLLPDPGSYPNSITKGPDKALWFTESGVNKIGRITSRGAISEYVVPPSLHGAISKYARPPQNSDLTGIVTGPDGNLWFTEFNVGKIGRITRHGVITEYLVPSHSSGPSPCGITAGPDGNLWFTEFYADMIGRITPDGAVTEFQLSGGSLRHQPRYGLGG
ncbi:MAG: hypothetical protein ABI456_04160, partial [Ktedonobacteraceae bacterium]